ncbi:MAG: serine/threonine-protein kinase [Gemmataceae bacterium]
MPEPFSSDLQSAKDLSPLHHSNTVDDQQTTDELQTVASESIQEIGGYEIVGEIARGGMGRILLAVDRQLQREVAIKTLLPGTNAARFMTESRITAQLPHPCIPPVHALGTLPDGTPYLVMKRIQGKTLSQLLKERSSLTQDQPQFLQIFEAIAQAVGFAHSQGIIHRDLKPSNIMVGAFGEVQVMDWGLAKQLHTPHGLDNLCEPISSLVSQEQQPTQAGTILGTPGFMAPEQAQGKPLDARADVFALGSILAVILTGKPAVVGTDAQFLIEQAARGELSTVYQRLDQAAAETELIDLAKRCLAVEPSHRPADAHVVAKAVADYRCQVEVRLQEAKNVAREAVVREAEQRKRRRQLVWSTSLITLVLVTGLAVSLWLLDRSRRAEQTAKQNEQQMREERDTKVLALQKSFQALRTLTDDIILNQMAQTPTLSEESRRFVQGIIDQYNQVAQIQANDALGRGMQAEGLLRVGMMLDRLGQTRSAEQHYLQARELFEQLIAESPKHDDFQQGYASLLLNLGLLQKTRGDTQQAAQNYQACLERASLLHHKEPTRLAYRHLLASCQNNLGNLQASLGDLAKAKQLLMQSETHYRQLVASLPEFALYRHELANSKLSLGGTLSRLGESQEAERSFRESIQLHEQLVQQYPNRPDYRSELVGASDNLLRLLQQHGRFAEAEEIGRLSILHGRKLIQEFPLFPNFRHNLASTLFSACCK